MKGSEIIKYLKFLKTIRDKKIEFQDGEIYPVTYEHTDCYILGSQYGIKCGIGKECENEVYVVIQRD